MIGTLVIVVRVCLFCGPDLRNVYCRALVISYRFAPDSCFVGFLRKRSGRSVVDDRKSSRPLVCSEALRQRVLVWSFRPLSSVFYIFLVRVCFSVGYRMCWFASSFLFEAFGVRRGWHRYWLKRAIVLPLSDWAFGGVAAPSGPSADG